MRSPRDFHQRTPRTAKVKEMFSKSIKLQWMVQEVLARFVGGINQYLKYLHRDVQPLSSPSVEEFQLISVADVGFMKRRMMALEEHAIISNHHLNILLQVVIG
jgi:hypothetical protein